MTITKRSFIALAACALSASLFAGHHHHRPLPRHAPPGAYWCTKCDGDGYNWTWYGWKKTCGVCDGRGWLVKKNLPPPKPVVAPHHHGKPHGGPVVAPKPAPHGKTPPHPPKGKPRR